MVRGCEFQTAHPGGQVLLGSGTNKAVVTGNIMAGPQNVTNSGAVVAVINDNAAG